MSFTRLFNAASPVSALAAAVAFLFLPVTLFGSGVVTVCTEAALKTALAGGGVVTIACDGTIPLSSSIFIAQDTVLDASGHNIAISGTNSVQVFDVNFAGGGGNFTLINITVTRGRAFSGSGMNIVNGTVHLMNCTFATNQTLVGVGTFSSGAAIRNSGVLNISGCTFVGNKVNAGATDGFGGAIYNNGAMSITNSTFTGNVVAGFGGRAVAGGAIYNVPGSGFLPTSSRLINCTLADNLALTGTNAAGLGGNIFNSGSLVLLNCILANNVGTNVFGTVTDAGHNLSSDATPPFSGAGSHNDTDAKLGSLANNGGPTLTMALLDGSPAIDTANSSGCPPTDQRGVLRPSGAGCDIGAFEASGATTQVLVQFSAANYTVNKNGTNALISVLRLNGATGTVSVAFATRDGTAFASTNYLATNGVLTFAPGETNKSFQVRILDAPLSFGDKTVSLQLANATGGAILANPSSATLTIIDNVAGASLQASLDAGGTITFPTDTTLTLTNTLVVTRDIILDGSGRSVTLSGGNGSNGVRVFYVTNNVSLTLRHVTIANGKSPNGAGIFNDRGAVHLANCTFSANRATGSAGRNGAAGTSSNRDGADGSAGGSAVGGAIYNRGNLYITNSTFVDNTAIGGGGGKGGNGANDTLFGGNGGDGGNAGQGWGGGIYSTGQVFVLGTTFDRNRATGGSGGTGGLGGSGSFPGLPGNGGLGNNGVGGAIYNVGLLTLTNCALMGNSAVAGNTMTAANEITGGNGGAGSGGAIYSVRSMNVYNCTVAANSAKGGNGGNGGNGGFAGNGGNGGNGTGGGIYAGNDAHLVNCTVATNAASAGMAGKGGVGAFAGQNGSNGSANGGNIARQSSVFDLVNTIVADSGGGANCWNGVSDLGHNISSDGSCRFTAAGSRNTLNPHLGPLADNGGSTKTMALLTNSPAIDAADDAVCPAVDQRGITRPQGAACDIGAFEFVAAIINSTNSAGFSISGKLLDGTNGLSGITVIADGRTAVSGVNGDYIISGLTNGSYLVTPAPVGAGFVPPDRSVIIAGTDAPNINFAANQPRASSIIPPPAPNPAGPFAIQFAAMPQQTYQVETSTNLINWALFTNAVADGNGLFSVSATNSPPLPQQFFRTSQP